MRTPVYKILFIALIALISLNYSCTTQRSVYSDNQYYDNQEYVDFQLFYNELSPYGQWVDYPNYGYVWIPQAGYGFAPYATNGYWVNTEYGWTWVSNYRWGWAPFHYGRWDLDNRLGWFWIPGNEWAPAWVSWRRGNGYYGWAPLGPNIRDGYRGYREVDRWHFVHDRDFGSPDIYRRYVSRRDYGQIINNSSVINNTHVDRRRNATYISGPEREEVQRVTGRRFNSLSVQDNNRPGTEVNKDQLRVYRPQVESNSARAQRPAPSRVYSRDEIKEPERRSPGSSGISSPNVRRQEKIQQMERDNEAEPQYNERRQQRTDQRRQQIEQRQQNKTQSTRPLGQPKREVQREEKSQQIEQQQAPAQTPSSTNPLGGRRK